MTYLNEAGCAPKIIRATRQSVLLTLVGNKTLEQFMNEKEEGPAMVRMLMDLCERLQDIQKKNMSHNDIKMDNILVNTETGDISLIDFGMSTHFGENLDQWQKMNKKDIRGWRLN